MTTEFALVERDERDSFNMLSSRLKESQEKERARAERVKYWSIIGSIFGTVLGIFGSSINNELKMRELRKLVSVFLLLVEIRYVRIALRMGQNIFKAL